VIARVELQLSDEEWLDLDYRQFRLLHDRWLSLRWQDQWQSAMAITAIYRNGMRTYNPLPIADDFIFTLLPGQKQRHAPDTVPMTVAKHQQIADLFRSIAVEKTCPVQ
jgi:hypothetical protein